MQAVDRVVAIMLAGGRGSRLHDLTDCTCKPALPFAGGRRIVDWTLGCLATSGIADLVAATQYRPDGLERHIRRQWLPLFRTLRLARGTVDRENYAGTADAVRRNLRIAEEHGARDVLVVAADHVHDTDFAALIAAHRQGGAGITVACTVATRAAARAFGVISAGSANTIAAFAEKPRHPAEINGEAGRCLVSMGIYVCRTSWLTAALAQGGDDFGHDILPRTVAQSETAFHRAHGPSGKPLYWQDVGTLDTFRRIAVDLIRDPTLCRAPIPKPQSIRPDLRHWAERGSFVMPGAWVARGAGLDRAIVAPGARVPGDLTVGRDPDEDRRWFRVTADGTVLVTQAMLDRREERPRSVAVQVTASCGSHGAIEAAGRA